MHARCIVGDVFGANACECSANLRGSLDRIAAEGVSAVIYLHLNTTGFSAGSSAVGNSLLLHADRKNLSQLDRDRQVQRDVGVGAQILRDLNLRRIRLLTNHARPVAALERRDAHRVHGSVGCEYKPAAKTEEGLRWRTALAGRVQLIS